MSRAPGAAVSFMWDTMQDQPCLFIQLTSSSDAERIFSMMNDIYHGALRICAFVVPPGTGKTFPITE